MGHLEHWQFQQGAQRSVLSERCFLFLALFPGSPPQGEPGNEAILFAQLTTSNCGTVYISGKEELESDWLGLSVSLNKEELESDWLGLSVSLNKEELKSDWLGLSVSLSYNGNFRWRKLSRNLGAWCLLPAQASNS